MIWTKYVDLDQAALTPGTPRGHLASPNLPFTDLVTPFAPPAPMLHLKHEAVQPAVIMFFIFDTFDIHF